MGDEAITLTDVDSGLTQELSEEIDRFNVEATGIGVPVAARGRLGTKLVSGSGRSTVRFAAMKPRFFRSPAEFRSWLENNHAGSEVWVGLYKKGSGRKGIIYSDAVDEALCFGWIDGLTRSIDESRWMIRFTPRKQRSNWSAVNIKRFGELRAEGRVAPPGRGAFERRDRRERKYSYESPPKRLDPQHEKRFRADEQAWAFWQTAPPTYRKAAMFWVMSAVREETRNRRLGVLIESSRKGERVPPLTPPKTRKK